MSFGDYVRVRLTLTIVLCAVASVLFGCGPRRIANQQDNAHRTDPAFVTDGDFQPLPSPGPQDWLATHKEPGQTFEAFQHARPNRPDAQRQVIYLQPIGAFPAGKSPSLDVLSQYAAAFFQMRAEVRAPISLDAGRFTSRTNSTTGRRQILTTDVLSWLAAKLPADAFCMLGITTEDLYPDPAWNFVFGEASLTDRVGIYSFARYDPAFSGGNGQELLLRRSMKVLTHETTHMFGLTHCIYYRCVMNGSNHLQESDDRPLHLCPICLRKLQASIGFDVAKRYDALHAFYEHVEFADDAAWVERRREKLGAKQSPPAS